ncbi:MAG: hypothetical protein ACRC8S_21020 [Fimbriiglobus sp.]
MRRYGQLVKEHSHVVNAAVRGLSALPGTRQAYSCTRAMSRFLQNDGVPFSALIELPQDTVRLPQDTVRNALKDIDSPFVLVVHDWSMFAFNTHKSKIERYKRSHGSDFGYELGSALALNPLDGQPLGPIDFRLRTQNAILTTPSSRQPRVARTVVHVLCGQTDVRWVLGG